MTVSSINKLDVPKTSTDKSSPILPYSSQDRVTGRQLCGSPVGMHMVTPNDLFNCDVNDDWFEEQPNHIAPISILTIGTNFGSGTKELKGVPTVPNFVVSPWCISSIEPDLNLKPLL